MTEFIPGAGPPPHRMPSFTFPAIGRWHIRGRSDAQRRPRGRRSGGARTAPRARRRAPSSATPHRPGVRNDRSEAHSLRGETQVGQQAAGLDPAIPPAAQVQVAIHRWCAGAERFRPFAIRSGRLRGGLRKPARRERTCPRYSPQPKSKRRRCRARRTTTSHRRLRTPSWKCAPPSTMRTAPRPRTSSQSSPCQSHAVDARSSPRVVDDAASDVAAAKIFTVARQPQHAPPRWPPAARREPLSPPSSNPSLRRSA